MWRLRFLRPPRCPRAERANVERDVGRAARFRDACCAARFVVVWREAVAGADPLQLTIELGLCQWCSGYMCVSQQVKRSHEYKHETVDSVLSRINADCINI